MMDKRPRSNVDDYQYIARKVKKIEKTVNTRQTSTTDSSVFVRIVINLIE